jgi:hypothetical protein
MRNFIIGLLLGGAVGTGITYFVMKNKNEKVLAEEVAKARKEYKEYYEQREEEENVAKITHVKAIPDKPTVPKEYTELVKEYDRAELEHPTEEDLIEMTDAENKMHDALDKAHDKPKLIKIESFGEIQSYDTESLTYYVYDRTLVHEDQTIVDDEAFLIGDALDRYGWRDDDADANPLYVRNYKIQKDFEIIKVFAEYGAE